VLGVLWRSLKQGHYSSENHFGVEAAEIYWPFVDVVWILSLSAALHSVSSFKE
jgi:cytochrome c oxidase subunit 3